MKLGTLVLSCVLLLMPRLAQGSHFGLIPHEIQKYIALNMGYDFPAFSALAQTSSPMQQVIQDLFRDQNFIAKSKWGVKIEGKWLWWHDALKRHKNVPIIEDCGNPDYIFANLPAWDEESKIAAHDDTEPAYLKTITSLAAVKIRRFIWAKESSLISEEDLVKHAYSVLFVMRGFNNTSYDAAMEATIEAVRYAAWDAAYDAAREAAWNAAWNAAWDAPWNASQNAAWNAAYNAAWNAAWKAAYRATKSSAKSSAMDITWDARQVNFSVKFAYRAAEKTVLIYFGQHADTILAAAYDAALAEMTGAPVASIFASPEVWQVFKAKYFGKLTPDQVHFLQAWLDELDGIAKKIEGLED